GGGTGRAQVVSGEAKAKVGRVTGKSAHRSHRGPRMFKKVLVANRGEIAVRVMQTLAQMSIRTVAGFSQPDRTSLDAAAAEEAYPLTGKTAAETYLRGDHIIAIAKEHGCDAIHPGYGFLAENEDFAQACADAGIAFIGPRPAAIREMGDKVLAKQTM